ncbi:MAG: hypothetical protein IPH13_10385 [Planctomycetes bacterium]|nr:hypothetical protein [Planctomycetota bacterium]MCC7171647.1 hypothetical protein [Planctomycetota bacterium]
MSFRLALVFALALIPSACKSHDGSFGADVALLSAHTETIVLQREGSPARVAVVPAYQGRVMTSSARGDTGTSFGWVNADLVARGPVLPQFNPLGGEDRLWIGPEAGQFGFFFPPGKPFTFEHWQTPAVIDTEPFDIVERAPERVVFQKETRLVNWSGTAFDLKLRREVELLDDVAARTALAVPLDGLAVVAFESRNTVENRGTVAWTKDTGLPSIWILSMYTPTPRTTVAIPYREGDEAALGPIVNDRYFGAIDAARLHLREGTLFFKADGKSRGKLGLSPMRALGVAGAYDAGRGVLTIVQYTVPPGGTDYVNSMWEHQDQPFSGDVINSYNDGPVDGGKPLGPFFELETSSPALALEPAASYTHVHRSFHLEGDRERLDRVARSVLGVGLDAIEHALP